MNILETFLILFESNADDVQKGADKAAGATDNLEEKIKKTDTASDSLGKSFMGMAAQAALAIGSLVSVGAILGSVFAAADYADYLNETSESLGVNIEQLDLWGRAATIAGGSTQGLVGSVKSLSAGIAQMDVTGKSRLKPFFDDLGISMTDAAGKARDAFDIFPELADAFEGMSKQEAIGFGRKLGIDDGTIMLLQKGRREIDALIKRQKELGTISAEDAKIADAYKDSIDELSFAWRSFSTEIAGDTIPALTWLAKKLTDISIWMRNHEGFIYGFLGTIGAGLVAVASYFFLASGAATTFFAVLISPIALATAAFIALGAAVGLIWDDFKTFRDGGDYLIPWEKIIGSFEKIKTGVTEIWGGVVEYISNSIDALVRMFETLGNFFSFGDRAYMKARMSLSAAGSAQINSATSSSLAAGSNRSTSVNIGEINVQTQATDADGISAEIGRSMKGQVNQVISNYDDGIRG